MVKKTLKKETSELIISVIANKKTWQEEQNKVEKDLIANVSIKGFRKGKVPIDIAKKSINQTDIFSKAIKNILNNLAKEASKSIQKEVILDGPSYIVQKVSDVELEIDFIYPIYSEIKINDYKKIGVKFQKPKYNKSLVDVELKKLQEQHAILIDKDKVEKENQINFDYEGFINGKTFEGGKAEKFDLKIGSKQFIPGFEEQMIGLQKGKKYELKVTFPKNYQVEKLRNKESIFKIFINKIQEKKLPELNDDLVKETNISNVKTLIELKKHIENIFKQQEQQKARADFQKEVFIKIKEKTKIIIPPQLLFKEIKNIAIQFEESLKKQGLNKKKYKELAEINDTDLEAQFKIQAENKLKDSLIFAEIAQKEKIELIDKDYEKEYDKLAKIYGQSKENIKNIINKQQMQIHMTNDRVIDALLKYSNEDK